MRKDNFFLLKIKIIVVSAGVAIMALEVTALNIMAPYFGTALLVNSNIIGIILFFLAWGYRCGGARGDQEANHRQLSHILFLSALWIGLVFPFRDAIASFVGTFVQLVSVGSFLVGIIFFAVPSFLLGAVLPLAIKIFVSQISSSGKSGGTLYAMSSSGSIAGTLLFGLFLLPRLGISGSLFLIVFLLSCSALLLGFKKYLIVLLLITSFGLFYFVHLPDFLFHKNKIFTDGRTQIDLSNLIKLSDQTSIFSRLQVYQGTELGTQKTVRLMSVNGEIHSASYLDSNDLVFNYARYNRLAGHFNPVAKKALLIGGGAYSYANYFLADTPLYDREKVWKMEGKYYYNNKTVTVPILMTNDNDRVHDEAELVYIATSTPEGRAAIEGEKNKIVANNQNIKNYVVVKEADIVDTGFPVAEGYIHIHETKNDGTPGAIISPNIPVGGSTMLRPRSIVGEGSLISGHNENVIIPLKRPIRDGEVLYAMLHRDNGNKHFDPLLVDGYEQIENLDVVEIDPRTTNLATKYFHLNLQDPRLRIFNEDGRTYINRSKDTYDIIYLDAFRSFYSVPWQLTTIEATRKIFNMLRSDGVVVANVPAALKGRFSKFFQAEFKTYQQIFPEVHAYAVFSPTQENQVQNIIIIAFKSKDNIRTASNDDEEINNQLTHRWEGSIDIETPILTDDFAPTDNYTNEFVNLHNF